MSMRLNDNPYDHDSSYNGCPEDCRACAWERAERPPSKVSLNDNRDEMDRLESLMDQYGVTTVLEAVATVCNEKADHLRSNWSDEVGAKRWEKAARRVEALTGIKGGLPT